MTDSGDGRVFIAYDPQDTREAQDLCARLEQAGFRAWLPGRDTGTASAEQAYATARSAAAQSSCLLLVLSGRPVNLAMLGDLTQIADSAGKPIIPIRVAPQAQVPNFPALARAKAWIDGCGPAASQEFARLAAELGALAPRHVFPPAQQPAQAQWSPAPPSFVPPQAPPPPPVPAAQPYAAAPAYPPAAPAQVHADFDWGSTAVQPGETSLGSWLVAYRNFGPDASGALTVTNLRILFEPKVAGVSLVGMLLSQLEEMKDRNRVALPREQVVDVRAQRRMINNWIFITTADGAVLEFNRGLMSADPILAALQAR